MASKNSKTSKEKETKEKKQVSLFKDHVEALCEETNSLVKKTEALVAFFTAFCNATKRKTMETSETLSSFLFKRLECKDQNKKSIDLPVKLRDKNAPAVELDKLSPTFKLTMLCFLSINYLLATYIKIHDSTEEEYNQYQLSVLLGRITDRYPKNRIYETLYQEVQSYSESLSEKVLNRLLNLMFHWTEKTKEPSIKHSQVLWKIVKEKRVGGYAFQFGSNMQSFPADILISSSPYLLPNWITFKITDNAPTHIEEEVLFDLLAMLKDATVSKVLSLPVIAATVTTKSASAEVKKQQTTKRSLVISDDEQDEQEQDTINTVSKKSSNVAVPLSSSSSVTNRSNSQVKKKKKEEKELAVTTNVTAPLSSNSPDMNRSNSQVMSSSITPEELAVTTKVTAPLSPVELAVTTKVTAPLSANSPVMNRSNSPVMSSSITPLALSTNVTNNKDLSLDEILDLPTPPASPEGEEELEAEEENVDGAQENVEAVTLIFAQTQFHQITVADVQITSLAMADERIKISIDKLLHDQYNTMIERFQLSMEVIFRYAQFRHSFSKFYLLIEYAPYQFAKDLLLRGEIKNEEQVKMIRSGQVFIRKVAVDILNFFIKLRERSKTKNQNLLSSKDIGEILFNVYKDIPQKVCLQYVDTLSQAPVQQAVKSVAFSDELFVKFSTTCDVKLVQYREQLSIRFSEILADNKDDLKSFFLTNDKVSEVFYGINLVTEDEKRIRQVRRIVEQVCDPDKQFTVRENVRRLSTRNKQQIISYENMERCESVSARRPLTKVTTVPDKSPVSLTTAAEKKKNISSVVTGKQHQDFASLEGEAATTTSSFLTNSVALEGKTAAMNFSASDITKDSSVITSSSSSNSASIAIAVAVAIPFQDTWSSNLNLAGDRHRGQEHANLGCREGSHRTFPYRGDAQHERSEQEEVSAYLKEQFFNHRNDALFTAIFDIVNSSTEVSEQISKLIRKTCSELNTSLSPSASFRVLELSKPSTSSLNYQLSQPSASATQTASSSSKKSAAEVTNDMTTDDVSNVCLQGEPMEFDERDSEIGNILLLLYS